jgi:branched-chain amino acid transport system substrate-binding protein
MGHFRIQLCAILALVLAGAAPLPDEVLVGVSTPRSGTYSWAGVGAEEGAEIAVADLNAKGGVLGKSIEMIKVDDYCAADQAVAAAKKLVMTQVAAAFGPLCSGAAISASKVFAEAGVLMISPTATNPKLTEQGFPNVFRIIGRDDIQGKIAGDLLASRWPYKRIAIVHDGQEYGKGLAVEVKKRLNERGVTEVMFEAIEPRKADYSDFVRTMQALGAEVLYYAGYAAEAALLVRLARERGAHLQLVGGDALGVEDFSLIAGPASDGTLFTTYPGPHGRLEAAGVAARITRSSLPREPMMTYAAFQVWAQAVEEAGTFDMKAVADALRSHKFNTVLGRIGFDKKGDVTGNETFVWYQWLGGRDVLLQPDKLE